MLSGVLHCIPTLEGGGAERQLAYLATGLRRAGVDVGVAYTRGGWNLARLADGGVDLRWLRSRGGLDPMTLPQLVGLLRAHRPSVVHTWLTQMDVVAGVAALICGIPFVVAERSCESAYGAGWRDRVRVVIARRARRIVANSEGGRRFWADRGLAARTVVIPNALPLEELGGIVTAAATAGVRPGRRILVAGRYSAEKNHVVLLQALDRALVALADVEVDLYGDGPERGRVLQLREGMRARERVRVNGYSERLWAEMATADLVVSASLFEGNPNVVLEAGALGRPLVLSDIPAHREVFGEDAAYFAPAASAEQIAAAMVHALRAREEAAAKGRAAQVHLRSRSIQAVTNQYLQVYRDVLTEHPR